MQMSDINKNGVEKKTTLYVQNLYVDNFLNSNPAQQEIITLNPPSDATYAIGIYNASAVQNQDGVIILFPNAQGTGENSNFTSIGMNVNNSVTYFSIVGNNGTANTGDTITLEPNLGGISFSFTGYTGTSPGTVFSVNSGTSIVAQISSTGQISGQSFAIGANGDYDVLAPAATSTATLQQPYGSYTFVMNYWNSKSDTSTNYDMRMSAEITSTSPAGYIYFTAQSNDIAYIYSNGVIAATYGFATAAAPSTSITAGTSPYTYTNSSTSNQELFITGGTITAIAFNPDNDTTSPITLNTTTSSVILRTGDSITITYSAAPTLTTIQV